MDEAKLREGMQPVPVRPVDRSAAVSHFLKLAGGGADFAGRLEAGIDRIIGKLQPAIGDELWLCRSRFVGPLAGHEGLGVVRDGKVVRYESIINY